MPYRILSFDGGGIRGVLTARLLARLDEARPGVVAGADLLAGTSTGGIIALCLANGMTTAEIVELYRANGHYMFDTTWLRHIRDVGGLVGADYSSDHVRKLLSTHLGTQTLGGLQKRVAITAFDTHPDEPPRAWKPKIFHNFPGEDSDGAELCVEVGMRTSAAPTFFPMHGHYVDGGVFANNPSMVGLAQALDPRAAGQQLSDLTLLSLGTGENPSYIDGVDHDWGIAQWARPLISILIDGVMGVADFQCRQLLGGRYRRVNPVLDQNVKLDDWTEVEYLLEVADGVDLGPVVEWLGANWV